MKTKPVIHIIDGNNFANRAYHAQGKQLMHDGKPIGTVFRFFNMLNKQIKEHDIKYIAVTFDIPNEQTFRFKMIEDWHKDNGVPFDKEAAYKAGRSKDPIKREMLPPQLKLIRTICKSLGLLTLRGTKTARFEADDFIGSIVALGHRSIIHSNDKDFIQLMGDFEVKIQKPDSLLLRRDVKEQYGVEHWQFIDFLALAGDKVDNIPHVKGVGPKTICDLLSEYGTISNIIKNKDKVKGVMGKALRKEIYCPDLKLTKKLATIKLDCPVPKDLSEYEYKYNDKAVQKVKRQYKFRFFMGG